MITLGIDTSCDDTSVALVGDKGVLVNLVSSHLIHSTFGGVVPEYASRAHTLLLYPMLRLALENAGLSINQVELIAVTAGPGLMGSVLCGLSFAKGLSLASGIPFVAVNHLEGHIYSVFLTHPDLTPPLLMLLVSGGHTQLILMRDFFCYKEIGATLDDACGEALDKVGKILGLGYPAGPVVERIAARSNCPVSLPRPNPKGFDFSYSGLKTAARNFIMDNPEARAEDIAAGLQEAAFDHLVDRVSRAATELKLKKVAVAGGVGINQRLREKLIKAGESSDFTIYAPDRSLCTDNAAMIASAGRARYLRQGKSPFDVSAFDRTSLEAWNHP